MDNIISDILEQIPAGDMSRPMLEAYQADLRNTDRRDDPAVRRRIQAYLAYVLARLMRPAEEAAPLRRAPGAGLLDVGNLFAGKRRTQSAKFGSCVKAVRKTVKARKGSNPESAAIAICTKSMLFPRGRTIKRYKKGRLVTQKRRR
jgi:hypothetical protein